MKDTPARGLTPARLLALCYAAAAALWMLRCLVGSGIMVNYKMSGRMPTDTLTAQDVEMWGLIEDEAPGREGWYVSTDSDPRIFWHGAGYIETVCLHATHGWPPGEVTLYYLRPGQQDYSETQKIYADCTAPGTYTFRLGGRWVTGLRIDPDSRGGIPTQFRDIQLNPAEAWYTRFVPTGGWWLALLFGPPLAAALLTVLARALCSLRRRPR